jgi:hypothetical protein
MSYLTVRTDAVVSDNGGLPSAADISPLSEIEAAIENIKADFEGLHTRSLL